VREGSRPISGDSGLKEIQALAEKNAFTKASTRGRVEPLASSAAYIEHLLGYVDTATLKPLKIVVNAGNGGAGAVVDLLEKKLPFTFIKLQHEADGNFPNGVPNPLEVHNRAVTAEAVRANGADIGVAWDGDFDRCFLFDENGEFIEGYYIVGLLADAFLRKHGGQRIVHDPRLTWNTIDVVTSLGGEPVQSKTGHAFIKERMRKENAIYGGEMSAHHYFRDFAYCDSGMIPWLLVTGLISADGKPLSALVGERMKKFPCSGEINSRVTDPATLLKTIEERYARDAQGVDYTDGLSMTFDDWRFNVRMSNTEPVVRLNVESRGNENLMREKTAELLTAITAAG
jgi:phosphomannomutase